MALFLCLNLAFCEKSKNIFSILGPVTIPYNKMNNIGDKVGDKLSPSQTKVLAEIRNNPNITKTQLGIKCNLSKTSIDNIILYLKQKD